MSHIVWLTIKAKFYLRKHNKIKSMKAKVLFGMFLIMSSLFWSCIDVFLNSEEEMSPPETNLLAEEYNLKSGYIGMSECDPVWIPLFTANETTIGNMVVSNTETKLDIEFVPSTPYIISNVQLWVGTDPNQVPKNRKNIPVPGKFKYKTNDQLKYTFSISLSEIYSIPEMLLEGKAVYIFAHATLTNSLTTDKFPVWSAGKAFNTNRWGTYSTYVCCHPLGGGGCFPHHAYCGEQINGINYFISGSSDKQKIYANNGEIIGNAFFTDEKIYFDFDQDWMFSGETPEVIVTGYTASETTGFDIYSGAPVWDTSEFLYCVPVSDHNLYQIELLVQFCTTENNYLW